jgi:regulator of protease activity HflC (stomatin/prohibitin superfamily)
MNAEMVYNYGVWSFVALIVGIRLLRSIRVVPQRRAYLVERLGRYSATLQSGFHVLLPFLDRVVAELDLREETIDVPPQDCFTQDEVKVVVDGVIYLSVTDPVKATYGSTNYKFAATQLAQTTTRSVIGQLSLDQTFEERSLLSTRVVSVLEQAGQDWGIRVHRYEIKNIAPPPTVHQAMEQQVTAERQRRALIAKSMGDKESRIRKSEGLKNEMVNVSEGAKQKRINEAEGRANEILALAQATAQSIEKLGQALSMPGGAQALQLQLGQRYLEELATAARPSTQILIPADLSDLDSLLRGIASPSDSGPIVGTPRGTYPETSPTAAPEPTATKSAQTTTPLPPPIWSPQP